MQYIISNMLLLHAYLHESDCPSWHSVEPMGKEIAVKLPPEWEDIEGRARKPGLGLGFGVTYPCHHFLNPWTRGTRT